MKKLLIITLILFSSCTYTYNAAGKIEFESHMDWGLNRDLTHPEKQDRWYGKPFRYHVISGMEFYAGSQTARNRLLDRYAYRRAMGISKGYSGAQLDWYIDRKISEGEANTTD